METIPETFALPDENYINLMDNSSVKDSIALQPFSGVILNRLE